MLSIETTGFPQDILDLLYEFSMVVDSVKRHKRIDEWNETNLKLISTIGKIFRKGLRKGMAQMILATSASFWPFVREFSVPETVLYIRTISRKIPLFGTTNERENAWIICSLNHKDLGIYLDLIQRNGKLVKAFYSASGGALLLSNDAIKELGNILRELDNTVFELSLEEYARYLDRSEEKSGEEENEVYTTTEAIPQEEEKQLHSPIPMIASQIERLETDMLLTSVRPEDLEQSETVQDNSVPLEEQNESVEISKETESVSITPIKTLSIEEAYENNEVGLRDHETYSTSEADQTGKYSMTIVDDTKSSEASLGSPIPIAPIDENISEHKELELETYSKSIIDTILMDGKRALSIESKEGHPIPSPGISVSPISLKREEIYSNRSTDNEAIDENSIKIGQEEIRNIVSQSKATEIQVVQGSSINDDGIYKSVLPSTPSALESNEKRLETETSPLLELNEVGFFGIPLDMGTLNGVLYPIGTLITRVGRLAWWVIASNALDDADDDLDTNHDPLEFLNPDIHSRIHLAETYGDNFAFELRTCPPIKPNSDDSQCYRCTTVFTTQQDALLCEITRNLYCYDCFGNMNIPIPARIVNEWDFEPRAVQSGTATAYLNHFKTTILDITQIAPELFTKVPELEQTELLRGRIMLAIAHVEHCKSGIHSQIIIDFGEREYLIERQGLYSIQDLIDLHSGDLLKSLTDAFSKLNAHIKVDCNLCGLRSRYCQLCKVPEAIYQFDRDIYKCPQCGMLSHARCSETVDHCINCRRVYMSIMSPSIDLPSSIENGLD